MSAVPAPPRPQALGQIQRAINLQKQADVFAAFGYYRAARQLRHEANQLRRRAAGRPEAV